MADLSDLEFDSPVLFNFSCRIKVIRKNKILGYCNLLREGSSVKIADIFIYDHSRPIFSLFPYLKIGENNRKQGIGSALLKHVISYCKAQNIDEIVGQAQGELAILIPWYKKHGFIVEIDNSLYMDLSTKPKSI